MKRRPRRSTRTGTLFPYTTLCRAGSETGHDRQVGARDDRRDRLRILRPRRIIVLAAEQVERAAGGVDLAEPAADVAVDGVEEQVAFEDARPALHVVPQRLPALRCRTLRSHQAGDPAGRALAAVHVAAVQPFELEVTPENGRTTG